MKKYIKSFSCLLYTFFKFCFIKIFHFKTFYFSGLNICYPFTEFEFRKGSIQLGKNLKTRGFCNLSVRNNGSIKIGKNFFMNSRCMIVCHKLIEIGDNVMLGPNVQIYDHDHDTKYPLKEKKFKYGDVRIGNNVWIGANSIILRGTIIEDDCVIAAGSIVKGKISKGTVFIQKREC